MVMLRCGERSLAWSEGWADAPHGSESEWGWAHHDVVITSDSDVVTFHPNTMDVLVLSREGTLLRAWPSGLLDGHGMTLVVENGVDRIWIADPGSKPRVSVDGSRRDDDAEPRVVKFSLEGERLTSLPRPDIDAYVDGAYRPTAVAVDEQRFGGSADIWVADGYGSSLVHRYTGSGDYVATIDGTDGAGRFNCPHALLVDRRRDQPELYIADRGNARIQVYGLDGTFRRVVGEGVLNSPSAMAVDSQRLVIGELFARLTVLGANDELLCHLGENPEAMARPGWPNALDAEGRTVHAHLTAGRLNSPHGLAVDADGNVYIAEWLLGGRLIRLLDSQDEPRSPGGQRALPG